MRLTRTFRPSSVILSHEKFDKIGHHAQFPPVFDILYPLARSGLFRLDAEAAHHASMAALRIAEASGLLGLLSPAEEFTSPVEVMGLKFPNRVGLAAGLDKEGNTIDALGRLGFGCIEIGTIRHHPPPPPSGKR